MIEGAVGVGVDRGHRQRRRSHSIGHRRRRDGQGCVTSGVEHTAGEGHVHACGDRVDREPSGVELQTDRAARGCRAGDRRRECPAGRLGDRARAGERSERLAIDDADGIHHAIWCRAGIDRTTCQHDWGHAINDGANGKTCRVTDAVAQAAGVGRQCELQPAGERVASDDPASDRDRCGIASDVEACHCQAGAPPAGIPHAQWSRVGGGWHHRLRELGVDAIERAVAVGIDGAHRDESRRDVVDRSQRPVGREIAGGVTQTTRIGSDDDGQPDRAGVDWDRPGRGDQGQRHLGADDVGRGSRQGHAGPCRRRGDREPGRIGRPVDAGFGHGDDDRVDALIVVDVAHFGVQHHRGHAVSHGASGEGGQVTATVTHAVGVGCQGHREPETNRVGSACSAAKDQLSDVAIDNHRGQGGTIGHVGQRPRGGTRRVIGIERLVENNQDLEQHRGGTTVDRVHGNDRLRVGNARVDARQRCACGAADGEGVDVVAGDRRHPHRHPGAIRRQHAYGCVGVLDQATIRAVAQGMDHGKAHRCTARRAPIAHQLPTSGTADLGPVGRVERCPRGFVEPGESGDVEVLIDDVRRAGGATGAHRRRGFRARRTAAVQIGGDPLGQELCIVRGDQPIGGVAGGADNGHQPGADGGDDQTEHGDGDHHLQQGESTLVGCTAIVGATHLSPASPR